MKFLKLVLVLTLGWWVSLGFGVHAQEKVQIQVLGRDDCSHCVDQKAFFEELAIDRDDFVVEYLDIYEPEYRELWEAVTDLEKLPKATPVTIVGRTVIQGFATPETTGRMIEGLIDKHIGTSSVSFSEYVAVANSGEDVQISDGVCIENCTVEPEAFLVSIPLLGAVDVSSYSLPLLSAVLGFVDGFNPCAMWVLVTFLLVLMQLKSRKKMWWFVGIFLLAEAIMYTLILTLWFSVWDFVALDRVVTPLVGLVAIGGGMYFLWEWKTSEGACKVGDMEQKRKAKLSIERLASKEFGLVAFLGIIGLAFSVNVIEFACSIGIPQAFTKILELNGLNVIGSLPYLMTYILFYMIDDLIVFGIALYSLEKIGLAQKYSKWANLIGGVLMVGLGLILILKPSWLTMV